MKRMKKIAISLACIVGLSGAAPAFAKDPCETVLCMFGMLSGQNPGECSGAVKDYFSIVVYKKGKPQLSKTSNARQKFLSSCPTAEDPVTKSINKKFGKVI